jgi:hypothetical protein
MGYLINLRRQIQEPEIIVYSKFGAADPIYRLDNNYGSLLRDSWGASTAYGMGEDHFIQMGLA